MSFRHPGPLAVRSNALALAVGVAALLTGSFVAAASIVSQVIRNV